MASTIAAGTSAGTAIAISGDTSGALVLQTNGTTTAVTISTAQVVTLAQPLPVASGGSGVTTSTGTGANVLGTSPTLTTPTFDSASLVTISGTAPLYMCRAWVNFNSTGTVSIYGSGNCSSITDNGVGNFTFNFTTAMPDVNYSVTTGPTQSSSNTNGGLILVFLSSGATYSAPLVGSFRFINVHAANTALGDSTYNCLSVFR